MSAPFPVAHRAHALAVARLQALGRCGEVVAVREGPGWYAVRTGAASNDLNGVVSEAGAALTPTLVDELLDWLDGHPASWLLTTPDPDAVELLTRHGATAETTGRWAGGEVAATLSSCPGGAGLEAVRVDAERVDTWLDLAERCEWIDGRTDLAARRVLMLAQLDQPAWSRWLVSTREGPAGFASAYVAGDTVELCDLGVLPEQRRRGVATALTAARLRHAARSGARWAVCAPSPDGWALYRSLGWTNVPVERDTCCYLPSR